MAARSLRVHRLARGLLFVLLPTALALGACHRKAAPPADNVPFVGPPTLDPVTQSCSDPAAAVLGPSEVEAVCGLKPATYLGVADDTGCQYVFQAGEARAFVRIQARTDMTVTQAFSGVRVRPVTGIPDLAEEGFAVANLWIIAGQRGGHLAYVEADKRLCSEEATGQLLGLALDHYAGPTTGATSAPASSPTSSASLPRTPHHP